MLHRKPYEQELHRIRANRDYTGSGPNSVPPFRSDLLSKIHPSLELKSFRYMDQSPTCPLLQATHGLTWQIVGFSGMGGDYDDPPPGWAPDPRNPPGAQANNGLDRHLARHLKNYDIEDPLVKREKAIPLGIIHSIVSASTFSPDPKTRQVADLVTLVFYFCLRSCEYTKCTSHQRTVQFRPLMDFVFFVGDRLLPADAPIEHFQHTTQIVLTLDKQKNSIRVESVSYFWSDLAAHCPV